MKQDEIAIPLSLPVGAMKISDIVKMFQQHSRKFYFYYTCLDTKILAFLHFRVYKDDSYLSKFSFIIHALHGHMHCMDMHSYLTDTG